MSRISRLPAALATASTIVLCASAAQAGGVIALAKPTITVAVPKPSVPVPEPYYKPGSFLSAPIFSRQGVYAGKPAVLQTNTIKWTNTISTGTRTSTPIVQTGKPVSAMPSISTNSAMIPPKPGVVPIASHVAAPAPAPAPVASKPPAPAPAAAPAAKPKVSATFTPVEYPAYTDQNGSVKGYYANGKTVSGLVGPTGGNCSVSSAYQQLGAGGTISKTYSPGMIAIKTVICYTKS